MAYSPALRPDPSEPGPAPPSELEVAVGNEPDLAVMTSTIAAQGIESSELALDLILHDIAERARQSTGASGAAIALEREGSMVCRAAAGATAPDLGVSINTESGLTGACVREERAQWCPDSEADDRVDAEACRQLQVRSIAVVPLFAHERVVGVFEIFSGEPRAFGERELKGLQELAVWVTEAVKSGGTKPPQQTDNRVEHAGPSPLSHRAESALVPLLKERPARARSDDHGTKALRAIVLSLAVLLCLLLGFRWGWQRAHLAKELNPPAPANAPVDVTEQPAAENQISAQHPKPSPAGERQAQTLSGLRLYQSGSVPGEPAGGKRENASDREVLSEKAKTDPSSKSRAERAAAQEAGQTSAPVDNVPFPSSETLARLSTAPSLPPLAADVRSTPSPLGVVVSRGVTPGRLIRRVSPTYPAAALQQRISGPVVLQARIGKDGRVHDVKVVRGHPFLATAAVEALRQWQYDPYKLNGQPVDLQTQVTINFNLP